MSRDVIYTKLLRTHDLPDGGIAITESYWAESEGTDETWKENCRTLAAEANADRRFAGTVGWVLVSLICCELLEPRRTKDATGT